jgi:hypothetical protein
MMNIDKLNASLMNIPCKIRDENWTPAEQFIYKLGHRDARHAAVEVVLEHARQQDDYENVQRIVEEIAKFCFGGPQQEGSVSMSSAYVAVVTALTAKDGLRIKLNKDN